MKNTIIMITFVFISTLFWGCSSQLCLQKRTDRLIEKSQKKTDTVYLYSVAFNDFNLVWYHKDNFIHGFRVKPHSTERYKPIEAKNIVLGNDSINKYFDNFLFKNIQCFESVLDGAWIKLYIKNKEPLLSSIDTECLFNTKFKPNSFPYKLQYDFFKLGISPIGFNFEEMYFE
jgi:hypothetical protein